MTFGGPIFLGCAVIFSGLIVIARWRHRIGDRARIPTSDKRPASIADLIAERLESPRRFSSENKGTGALRALIVEDIDYSATALAAVLRKAGIESEIIADGITALERLSRTSYDIAFIDWHLPGLDGANLIAKQRSTEKSAERVILIATTAYTAEVHRIACLKAGADAFVAKPLSAAKISDALRKLSGTSSTSGPGAAAILEPPLAAEELDVRLLHFLADETGEGFAAQVARYLALFGADVQRARDVIRIGDQRQIHRAAHRLLAHASAINSTPLIRLASRIQEESAILGPDELADLFQAVEREFSVLQLRLRAFSAPSERA